MLAKPDLHMYTFFQKFSFASRCLPKASCVLDYQKGDTFFAQSFLGPWRLILDICLLEFCFSELEERGEGLGGHREGGRPPSHINRKHIYAVQRKGVKGRDSTGIQGRRECFTK